ncbi:MAG: tetratricopeptide repeat protein [Parashewanella sp.]
MLTIQPLDMVNMGSTEFDSVELFKHAVLAQQRGQLVVAANLYQQLLCIEPSYFSAWLNLGVLNRKLKRFDIAIGCYQRALTLKLDDAGTLSNLANVLKDDNRLDQAINAAYQAIELAPTNVSFRHNYAIALREAKQFQQALIQIELCLKQQPTDPFLQWDRALILLSMQNYELGWPAFESRWRTGDLPKPNIPSSCQRWRGESFVGKKLLLLTEQGFGDNIFCARYIEAVCQRGGKVLLQCKSPLERLFSALPVTLVKPDEPQDDVDLYCPLMSLPGIFVNTFSPPAQLQIPEPSLVKVSTLLKAGKAQLQVGIIWSGSVTYGDNDKRSIALIKLLPLLAEFPKVRFYSLQKGPKEAELFESGFEVLMPDIGSQLDDFADTAALLKQLDLLIMTDSAAAHLAGSINTPILNLLQYKPGWLYFPEQSTTRWYDSMRLIWQQQAGDWSHPLDSVRDILTTLSDQYSPSFTHKDVINSLDRLLS